MRLKFLLLYGLLCLLLAGAAEAVAQTAKPARSEAQITKEFLRFLASQNGRHNRVDKQLLPWKLSEVYLNDSLWAKVDFSDQSRIAARQGLHGAGPQLRMDYRLTNKEFEQIKAKIRHQQKQEWTEEDFPEEIVVVQELGLAPAAYYAYSYPILIPAKKLILVKRHFHAEKVYSRWTCLEAYRILESGQFRFENCYQRTER
ncbi:hypothetical protein [Rufibacter psychrotolerans]|uniref:hypothetical protein n=1 Tax=Rufibacter psychrotolerans TaxID=2812556 RepID=UPI00196793AA|nr:hypothetical protein [Rufibacter sp. SYSU D00308]